MSRHALYMLMLFAVLVALLGVIVLWFSIR